MSQRELGGLARVFFVFSRYKLPPNLVISPSSFFYDNSTCTCVNNICKAANANVHLFGRILPCFENDDFWNNNLDNCIRFVLPQKAKLVVGFGSFSQLLQQLLEHVIRSLYPRIMHYSLFQEVSKVMLRSLLITHYSLLKLLA